MSKNENSTDAAEVAGAAMPPVVPSNAEPSKPLYKMPTFWQAAFSGILVINAIFTYALLREQRLLTRQQVVGTQAAEIGFQINLYSPDNTLSVSFDHRGVVAAKNVRLAFRAVRKKVPSLEDIDAPISRTIYEPLYSKDSYLRQQHDFSLPGLTPSEFEAMKRTEQTVKVEGEFSYDNGFGDILRYPVCRYWLIGIQNVTEDKGGANGFYPCEDFEIRVNNVLKARREAQGKN